MMGADNNLTVTKGERMGKLVPLFSIPRLGLPTPGNRLVQLFAGHVTVYKDHE